MKKIIKILLFIFILNAYSAEDYKLDVATSKVVPTFHGTVLLMKGKSRRINKQNPTGLYLEKGQHVFAGDTIETMPDATIKFQMTDDTVIALGVKSIFEIKNYEFQDKDKRKAIFKLGQGQLRASIHQIARVGDLEFHTKNTKMGVLGTEFLMNESDGQTQVALLSGKLGISSSDGQNKYELTAGQYTTHKDNKNEIKSLPENELNRLKAAQLKEEDDFKPFLELAKNTVSTKKDEAGSVGESSEDDENQKDEDKWKKVLNELNNSIKENNKK